MRGNRQVSLQQYNTGRKTGNAAPVREDPPKKNRRARKEARRRRHPVLSFIGRIFASAVLVGLMTTVIVVGAFLYYVMTYVDGSVDDPAFDLYNLNLDYTTTMYVNQADGTSTQLMQLHGTENRVWVDLNQIPTNLQNSFIAVEDKRFWQHSGVDWRRTIGAFAGYFFHTSASGQGGSTITQQLIKNLSGDNDTTASRKLQEIKRALNLEDKYSKDIILQAYLNTIPLGDGNYGVETAAKFYFGEDVSQLSLVQCASLAAITKNPSYYDPLYNPNNNKDRRDIVLEDMLQQNLITQAEYKDALTADLGLKPTATTSSAPVQINSYFEDQVIFDVVHDLMAQKNYSQASAYDAVNNKGLSIYTTLNPQIQTIVDGVYADDSNFLKLSGTVQPQSAMVVMDYAGHVEAIAGGRGDKTTNLSFDRATQALRPPGSTIKPMGDYSYSIQNNLITYSTLVKDDYVQLANGQYMKGDDGKPWPLNSEGAPSGKMLTVQYALQESINTVSARICQTDGIQNVYDWLTQHMGITSLVGPENGGSDMALSPLSLGQLTNGISVEQECAAYATFGNLGEYYAPTTYTKVLDHSGATLLQQKAPVQAMGADTAYILNKLMQTVVTRGTGYGVGISSAPTMPIFGKTGTSGSAKDRWFTGGTPYYVCACWFGYDQPQVMSMGNTNPCIKPWNAVMNGIQKALNSPVTDFPDTDTVEYRYYDTSTGNLATTYSSGIAPGYYKVSFEPPDSTSGPLLAAIPKPTVGTSKFTQQGSSTKNAASSAATSSAVSSAVTSDVSSVDSTVTPTEPTGGGGGTTDANSQDTVTQSPADTSQPADTNQPPDTTTQPATGDQQTGGGQTDTDGAPID